MPHPLMPKATAVWLVENTALTFDQIADFCGLHALEIQAIADGEVAIGMQGLDPVASGEVALEEIERCQKDPGLRLNPAKSQIPEVRSRPKGAKYTPVSKRQDRPDAIAWLLKNYPELTDAQISKLIGTTKPTINAVRDRSHWNTPNIKPQNPVGLGLCNEADLEKVIAIARAKAGTTHAATEATPASDRPVAEPPAPEAPAPAPEAAPEPAPELTAETLFKPAAEPAVEEASGADPAPGDTDSNQSS